MSVPPPPQLIRQVGFNKLLKSLQLDIGSPRSFQLQLEKIFFLELPKSNPVLKRQNGYYTITETKTP